MLPYYCKKIMDTRNVSDGKIKNLAPNLFDKERYVLHYKTL